MALSPEETEQVVRTALDMARSGSTESLVDFIDHGLPVNVWDEQHNTLLMLAAYHGHEETVRALIEHGADPNLLNSRGQSVISGALFKGEEGIVRSLLEAGSDLDRGSPTARETAALFGQDRLIDGSA